MSLQWVSCFVSDFYQVDIFEYTDFLIQLHVLTSKICRFVRRAKSNVPAICLAWSQLVKLDISPCKLSVKKTQTMSILEWIIPVKSSFALFRLKYKIKVEIINACCETDLHYWWNWLRLIITGVRIRLLLNSVCFISS